MTDDLVKRLRDIAKSVQHEVLYQAIEDEAADRIEQLEAVLREITQTAPFGEPQEIARAALEKTDD